jgi:HK97 family phage portal protein
MGFLDRLFGRATHAPDIEQKASIVGPLIVANSAGQAQWTKRDLQAYARDGYQQNPIVYRCVRLVATNAASLPIMARRGDRELPDHPAIRLLQAPSPFMSGSAFAEAVYSFRLISGNVFIEAVTLGKTVRELHCHRPERVKVVPGPDGYPASYEFQINGRTRRVLVNQAESLILHMKDFNPLDDWYGQSPLEAAAWAIDGHSYGAQEIATTLKNGGRLQGAFVYKGEEPLTDDQIGQAREKFDERLNEARRTRNPLVLNGTWDFKTTGVRPDELDIPGLKADTAREIALALGVPPLMLGLPGDSTYANYAEANRAFWRETIIPHAKATLAEIGAWLGKLTNEPDLVLEPVLDGIPALSGETYEKWKALNEAEFISVNEKREGAGYEPTDGGDQVLVNSGDIPLSDAGKQIAGGPEPDPEPDGDEQEDMPEADPQA